LLADTPDFMLSIAPKPFNVMLCLPLIRQDGDFVNVDAPGTIWGSSGARMPGAPLIASG